MLRIIFIYTYIYICPVNGGGCFSFSTFFVQLGSSPGRQSCLGPMERPWPKLTVETSNMDQNCQEINASPASLVKDFRKKRIICIRSPGNYTSFLEPFLDVINLSTRRLIQGFQSKFLHVSMTLKDTSRGLPKLWLIRQWEHNYPCQGTLTMIFLHGIHCCRKNGQDPTQFYSINSISYIYTVKSCIYPSFSPFSSKPSAKRWYLKNINPKQSSTSVLLEPCRYGIAT